MSEYYTGEIRMFAGPRVPSGWAFCDGRLLSISSNEVLYSLIGTTYGGDGRTTFALPDLRGRLLVGQGTGVINNQPMTARTVGQQIGSSTVTLTTAQIPVHSHTFSATSVAANSNDPGSTMLTGTAGQANMYATVDTTKMTSMAASAVTSAGSNMAHANMMPSMCINFIIALNGLYPSRPQ